MLGPCRSVGALVLVLGASWCGSPGGGADPAHATPGAGLVCRTGPVGVHAARVPILIRPGELRSAWLVSLILLLVLCVAALVMNYWVAACPVRSITVTAWALIVVSCVLLAVFVDPDKGLWVAIVGAGVGLLVQCRGWRVARARRGEQETRRRESECAKAEQDEALNGLVGERGVATSDIKPHGRADVAGRAVDVKSATFIPADAPVVVTGIDDGMPVVERLP